MNMNKLIYISNMYMYDVYTRRYDVYVYVYIRVLYTYIYIYTYTCKFRYICICALAKFLLSPKAVAFAELNITNFQFTSKIFKT